MYFHLVTTSKVSKCGVFSGSNTGKYEPEKTPYFDTFHAVSVSSYKVLVATSHLVYFLF